MMPQNLLHFRDPTINIIGRASPNWYDISGGNPTEMNSGYSESTNSPFLFDQANMIWTFKNTGKVNWDNTTRTGGTPYQYAYDICDWMHPAVPSLSTRYAIMINSIYESVPGTLTAIWGTGTWASLGSDRSVTFTVDHQNFGYIYTSFSVNIRDAATSRTILSNHIIYAQFYVY